MNRNLARPAACEFSPFIRSTLISIPRNRVIIRSLFLSSMKKADRLASRVFLQFSESFPAPDRPPPHRSQRQNQPRSPFSATKRRNAD
ncbi:hypothetical protein EZV77_03435 [Burkholderia thailandensis]|nr:hypothetical protein [Burkholderia thailandensis]MDD1484757.1 hypothetical protein [Burkholderia thailandensis]MDD1491464.1 hypothetical protein [Burkholderia thailandensis]PJO70776.1 hypothetical protein CWD92_19440 [Burkholderia thailandensis]TBW66943.1 hypothetical protein EZV77_03435 [Burkholderia thailandensis]